MSKCDITQNIQSVNKPFLPLSKPSISEDEIAEVADVLRSGWITTGAKNAELEQLVCDITGAQYAVALSSATAGMHLLLRALGIGPGDEVITPSMTWVSTANQIELCGATPVFVDVNRDTLMVEADMIEPLITERTRLIVPVHYAGASLDLAPLRQLAEKHGIPLVEDAAHAIGTRYGDQAIGGSGTAIFSFHPIKNITTGEGGMFCTDDGQLAEKIRQLRFHGLGVDAFDRETQGRAPQAEVLTPGYKYNLPDMNAVLGIGQLKRLNELNNRRAEIAALYSELLSEIDEIKPLQLPDYEMTHCWHLYIIRLDIESTAMSRDDFMQALKERQVGTGLHFRATHTQKYYREKYTEPMALPETEWNSERICSLPLYPDMTDDDVRRVVDTIRQVITGAG
ncbi:MAG: UDP-4-amino-4-deoxy-L-arabinose aminotransferase [Gammaproteobacteria bacterium]|nr:UDP-4-amino-4-deoxy-L-arabinose aminotransferase [Gammaproteobacteria bacterium]MBT8133028.1 UDP-4-amino-4-deoxy-L-arabinose aminotransferase [Gammaproteobacteria bacterium]NNJ50040.1 UDP-4-amino-4-deoxy-L-arabinose aminotransferase [Gammaproteobacteria bacterium]